MINRDVKQKEMTLLVRKLLYIAGLSILSFNVASAPTGGTVVGGAGNINQSGLNTTINQATQNLAIDWQSFDINSDERVEFIQPNTSSIALNRILGNNGSTIQGQIDANGQVILVNPNGVFFSSTATVNVGGLIASSLDITPSAFMNGDYIFNEVIGTDGAVINSGTINASLGGNVALIGKQVKNDGLISANLGSVVLAAGKQSVLTFDNQGLVGVSVTKEVLQSELGLEAAATNSGEINAAGGRVLLTASTSQDVFSQAVNNSAIEQATSVVVNDDGSFTLGGGADVLNTGSIDVSSQFNESNTAHIILVGESITSSGSIKADTVHGNAGVIELHANDKTMLTQNSVTSAQAFSSGTGGLIKVLGDKVGLTEFASINASGANGGGEVLLGGDRQGLNTSIRNADFIYLGENTLINADAADNGDGGRIITFAKDTARIYGDLSARGGLYSGNGGFIETSGLKGFEIFATPDVTAFNGIAGEWLIDPYNITIVAGGEAVDINGADTTAGDDDPTAPFTSSAYDATLGVNLIIGALNGGSTVSIITSPDGNTVADGPPGNDGNITLLTTLNYNGVGNATLTLQAENNINILGQIGDGSVVDNELDSLTLNFYAKGSVNIGSGEIINTQGGNFTVGDGGSFIPTSFTNLGSVITTGANSGGNTRANVAAGDIVITTSGTGTLTTGILTAFSYEVDRDLDGGSGGLNGFDGGRIQLISGGAISVNGELDASGGKADDDGFPARVGGTGGAISITSGADIDVTANILSRGGDSDGSNFVSTTGGTAGTITINAGNDFNLSSGTSITSRGGMGGSADSGPAADGGAAAAISITVGNNFDISGSIASVGGAPRRGGNTGPDNTVTINGDSSANIFTINAGASFSGSIIAINGLGDNDQFRISANIAGTLYGGAGDDIFTFRANQLSTTIVGGTESDTIVADTSNSQNNTWTITGDNTGTLVNQGSLSGFSEIENLTGNTRTDTFTFNNATDSWIDGLISGGGGSSDSLDISILDSVVTVQLGNDFISNPLSTAELNVDEVETILANVSLVNELKGENVDSNWTITNSGIGNVVPTTILTGTTAENTVGFTGFHTLTANISLDQFTFNTNGWINGLVSGGTNTTDAEQDTLDIQSIQEQTVQIGTAAIADGVLNVDGFEVITADSNVNRLSTIIGNNADNTWTITDLNRGTIAPITNPLGQNTVEFINFTHLTGNASIDQFTFNAAPSWINGLILGGNNTVTTENDTLNIIALGGTRVQLGGIAPTNGVLNVDQVESISANPGPVTNTLLGDNVASNWLISNINDGTVAPSAGANNQNTVAFFDFNTLTGGNLADSFTIGALGLIASIDGGSVDSSNATTRAATYNTLTGRTANTTWTITDDDIGNLALADAPNTVYVTNFNSIQNLTGSTADDLFVFNGDFTIAGLIDGQDHGAGDAVDFSGITTARIFTISDLTGYNNIEFYIGNDNNHSLQGNDISNDWVIQSVTYSGGATDGRNDGILNGTINFINFNTLIGGSADDTFSFVGDSSIENIDGGAISGIGTADYNTLIAKDTFNDWEVTGLDSGNLNLSTPLNTDVASFSNIQHLTGGTDVDIFDFTDPINSWVNGLISGGNNSIVSSLDELDISLLTAVTVQLGNNTTANLNVDQVEGIRANATSNPLEYNTLIGEDIASDWLIDGNNAGIVSPTLLANEQNTVVFNDFQQIVGGAQADVFTIDLGGEIADIDGGPISGIGTADFNTLIAMDRDNIWRLTRIDGGSLEQRGAPAPYVANFDSIQNILGGTDNDEFIFSNAVVMSGTVDGNFHALNGGDIVNVAAFTGGETFVIGNTGFLNVEGFIGGNDGVGPDPDFTLEITSGDNTWQITGINTGTLNPGSSQVTFEGFNNLTGGSGDDLFDFDPGSDITGIIAGGGESQSAFFSQGVGDIIDMSRLNGALAVNIALATDPSGVMGVERLIGNSNAASTLTGANQNNTWDITASNRGNVTSVDSLGGSMEFFDFPNLTGNLGRDDFTIYDGFSLTGNINGVDSALDNSLTIQNSGITNTWTVDATNGGTASVALGGRFSNIDDLTGGAVDDVFNILDTFEITGDIDGAGGTNTLSIATSSDNIWDIDGANTGRTTVGVGGRFSSISNLIGGSRDDTFDFSTAGSSLSGLITGGGQNSRDIVDMSVVSGAIAIDLSSGNQITGIERIIANNDVNTSLTAENINNTWSITSNNSGTVTSTISSGGTIEFIDFPNLFGNQGQDDFTINDGVTVSGNIDGVLDLVLPLTTNSLTIATSSNNDWDIDGVNTGTATVGINGRFSNMNIITGGSRDDTFLVRAAGSISNKINGGLENNFDTVDLNEKLDVDINIENIVAGTSIYNSIERFVGNNDGSLPTTGNSTITGENGTNTWTITGVNDGQVVTPNLTVVFENFNNLSGGSGDDRFNFNLAGSINGIISGGGQVSEFGDDVYMNATALVDVTLETTDDNTKTNLVGIERVTGNGANSTLTGADEDNTWTITDADDGTVANTVTGSITFIDFANLTGNSRKDDFTFNAGSSLQGLIDGGANGALRPDTVNMAAVDLVDITIGTDVIRIEEITGTNDGTPAQSANSSILRSGNALVGDTTWDITGTNTGTVTYNDGSGSETMTFIAFNDIEGGANNNDIFTINGGSISGSIIGGTGTGIDSVDYSIGGVDITIGAGFSQNGQIITEIEQVIGNGSGSTIRGIASGAPTYTWTLDGTIGDGVNDGRVVSATEDLQFINFANIVGGDNVDTFFISGNSSVTGTINGGAGSDIVNLTLTGVESGGFSFVGDIGTDDQLIMNGGNPAYTAVYTPNVSGFDQFEYSNVGNSYTISYEFASTETIQNNLIANTLTINGTSASDAITLNDTASAGVVQFKVNNSREVDFVYANNANIIIDGLVDVNDSVSILGNIGSATTDLTFANTSVTGSTNTLTADILSFNNAAAGVDENQRLLTNINSLNVSGAGPVYIQDSTANLDLSQLDVSGIVDVYLTTGNITNSSNLLSSAAFLAAAANGNINLLGNNQLSGAVTLLAPLGSIIFENNVDTVLADINTTDLRLNIFSGSGVTQSAGSVITTASLTLDSSGDFDLSNDNVFNNITVLNSNNVNINNTNSSNIIDVNAVNRAELSSNGITLGLVTADDVILNAGTSTITDANGGADNIVATTISLTATGGIGITSNPINTRVNGAINSEGVTGPEEISAVNSGGGDIAITNIGNVILRNISNLDNDGNIQIVNNGAISVDTIETITDFTDTGTGRIDLNVTNGHIYGVAKGDYRNQSDIRAESMTFLLDDQNGIGTGNRPLSIEVPETVEVLFSTQNYIFFYGIEPADFRGENEFSNQVFDLINNLAGQQLIEVESLAQIDPAIFTDVRNYSNSDIALMMPASQRYDIPDEEEEDQEAKARRQKFLNSTP